MTIARVIPSRRETITADPFLNDEASSEASEPREFADITHGTTTYRIAFGTRDMAVAGIVYTAIAAARGTLVPAGVGRDSSLNLTLPADHPLVQRYVAQGVPPRSIRVTLWRKQLRSGLIEQQWDGHVTSMSLDEDWTEATLLVVDQVGRALMRPVPAFNVSKTCAVKLYSGPCGMDRNAFKVAVNAISVNGRIVRLDIGAAHGGDWAAGGELTHVASGEKMTVIRQTDIGGTLTDLTLHAQIIGLAAGNAIEVVAGCDKTIETCSAKFANKQRFRGFPQLPSKNPFVPGSGGAIGSGGS